MRLLFAWLSLSPLETKAINHREPGAKPPVWNLLLAGIPVNRVNTRHLILVIFLRRQPGEIPLVPVLVVIFNPVRNYRQDFSLYSCTCFVNSVAGAVSIDVLHILICCQAPEDLLEDSGFVTFHEALINSFPGSIPFRHNSAGDSPEDSVEHLPGILGQSPS